MMHQKALFVGGLTLLCCIWTAVALLDPPAPDNFRIRVREAGGSDEDIVKLTEVAVILQNRMEASVALAYTKEQCVPMALKEVLLRLMRIRLAMPDVTGGETLWTDALGQLFQLPGSPGDGTLEDKGQKVWFLDMHGPVTIKPGVIAPGRSGTFLGDVERVNDTPEKKKTALHKSLKDVFEALESNNVRLLMHLSARAQEAGEKMEGSDKPAYVGTLRWILEKASPPEASLTVGDTAPIKVFAQKVKAATEPLGLNFDHLTQEQQFLFDLQRKAKELKLSYGLLSDSKGWDLFVKHLPDAYHPEATSLDAAKAGIEDAKAMIAEGKECDRCVADLEKIIAHVSNKDNQEAELNKKFVRNLPPNLVGKAGEDLLTYSFGKEGAEQKAQIDEAFKATASEFTDVQGAALIKKKGLMTPLPPTEVLDRAGDATSTFRGKPDFKLAGEHWSALTDKVGEGLGFPPLTNKEKEYLTKYSITNLPGFGVGGYVWPNMKMNVINARFLMNLRTRLLGADAGPSGTTDELMQMGDYTSATLNPWLSWCLRGNAYVGMVLVDHHSWDEVSEGAESPDRVFRTCPADLYKLRKRPEYVTFDEQCSWKPSDPFDLQTVEPTDRPAKLLKLEVPTDLDKGKLAFKEEPLKWTPFDVRAEAQKNYDLLSKSDDALLKSVEASDFPNKYTPNKKRLKVSDEPASTPELEALIEKLVCKNPKFDKSWGWRYEFCEGRAKYLGIGASVEAILDGAGLDAKGTAAKAKRLSQKTGA